MQTNQRSVVTFLLCSVLSVGMALANDGKTKLYHPKSLWENPKVQTSLTTEGPETNYDVNQVFDSNGIQYRFYFEDFHFMTIIDHNGTFNLRPHPGMDVNGWGSSWYLQPFLPGAELKHTTIEQITLDVNGIRAIASGYVSKDVNDTYGVWDANLTFSYMKEDKRIDGNGLYSIAVDESLLPFPNDLNLYKIASNYLDDVPLLTGGIGDTGDMNQADVNGGYFAFTWNPADQPAHFPQDPTDNLSINVLGQLNNVDTAAQGHQPIDPAYKPSLKVILNSHQPGVYMIFGAMYDTDKSEDFGADNVGITPLILKHSLLTNYDFNVIFEAVALSGDGIDLNFDKKVNFIDYSMFAQDWKETGENLVGDINKDGVVDRKDLDELTEIWLTDCD